MPSPRRVSVVGNSGSGKSTLAARIADRLGVPLVELDAIHHQPGWTPLAADELRERVGDATTGLAWVVDGNYRQVLELVWERADTVVWLDLPRSRVMRQIVRRTLRRVLTREELWNGNRERVANLLRWDPEASVIRWAWTRHHIYREGYGAAVDDPRWADVRFVRLRSHDEAARWLASL